MDLKPANLKRYASVARLLLKYGRAGQQAMAVQVADEEPPPESGEQEVTGDALARDLEALGPTFIKLGQVLSSRSALLPPAWVEALERLQDSVEPFPAEEVERIVTEELGVRISKGFESFELEPLASASLGQVHRATLRDGRPVVVKVQRPGIRQQIAQDLEAFEELAGVLERHTRVGAQLDLPALIQEFRKTIFAELDYRREAENLERLAENLQGFERIVVPRPVPDYTTSRVLTMDHIPGQKITRISPLTHLEVDGEALADELFQAYLKQTLVDGFFHADPHPGNVFLTPDNRIALLDLGMVARLSPRLQDTLLRLVLAVAEGRGDEAAEHTFSLVEERNEVDQEAFRRQVAAMVGEYTGRPIAGLPIGQVFLEIVQTATGTGARLPPEMALLGKTLYHLEAVGRALAPGFDPAESVRRHAARLLRQRMFKSFSPGSLYATVLELREFADRLPGRLNRLLDSATTGRLGLKLDTGIDAHEVLLGFQKVANRITMGLVLAALIVGAAMLMQVQTSFRIFGYPGFAILLFLLAAAAGIVLLLTIAVKDRR
jgi:predicted unusual protein kinase regulating ubiquinone biosynthesis (AarF/ABC1/UbiB family)